MDEVPAGSAKSGASGRFDRGMSPLEFQVVCARVPPGGGGLRSLCGWGDMGYPRNLSIPVLDGAYHPPSTSSAPTWSSIGVIGDL